MVNKLTDDEINALAEDIYMGKVFTSDHLRETDLRMLPQIFTPLILADETLRAELLKEPIGMIYEHLSEAGSRSVNGYPIFFSFHAVSQDDAKRVWEKVEQIKKAVSGVVNK